MFLIKRIKQKMYLQENRMALLFAAVLFSLHLYQYFDSNYMFQPLERVIMYATLAIFSLFFDIKYFYWIFYIFGLFLEISANFDDYETFFIVFFGLIKYPNKKLFLIVPYLLAVVTVATLHLKSPVHIYIHLISCAGIYLYARRMIFDSKPKYSELELTDDDQKILGALALGIKQDKIEGMSPSTVSRRLTECRERNHCNTTDELMLKYLKDKI